MDAPDVNVLVHAFRRDSSDHAMCRAWLENRLASEEAFALIPLVLAGFIRVVTHPRIFRDPSKLSEAVALCEFLPGAPTCREIDATARHWTVFLRLCRETKVSGNSVPDAWLAAIAIQHHCRWITLDRSFTRSVFSK